MDVEGCSAGASDSEGDAISSMDGDSKASSSSDDDASGTDGLSSSSTSSTGADHSTVQQSSMSILSTSSDADQSSASSDDEPSKLQALCKSLLESKIPLYPDSKVTILESYILLYEYALWHSLTKEAFKELIQLISILILLNAKSAKLVYLLQNFFKRHFNDTKGECYYYCAKCHRSVKEGTVCPSGCNTRVGKFLYVPFEPQLKQRLEGPFVWSKLQLRLKRVFTSSKRELWPVRLAIDELPSNLRGQLHHSIPSSVYNITAIQDSLKDRPDLISRRNNIMLLAA